MNEIVNERNHEASLLDRSTKSMRLVECQTPECQNAFTLFLSDKQYNNLLAGKHKHFCSRCQKRARKARHARNIKIHFKQSLKTFHFRKCRVCKNYFLENGNVALCSAACKKLYAQDRARYLSEDARRKLSEAGRRSISKQFERRRSKSEILFCKFCEDHFSKVEHNKSIFNGWDADVLLTDLRIAILWNGPWHYRNISKRKAASLKAIQNRDALKRKEIQKAGWSLYVVKDIEKHRSQKKQFEFVQKHFERFVEFVSKQKNTQFFEEFSF